MAILKSTVYPKVPLTTEQEKNIRLAEVALDALLQINGSASTIIRSTKDQRVRDEIHGKYTNAGWRVYFVGASNRNIGEANPDYFYVDIN